MFRKTIMALTAVAAVGAAVAAPTTADAGWRHHHRGFGFYGPALLGSAFITSAIIANGCYQRRWIDTPYGPRKVRVNVC
jgi:hypothetical protein